jgi:hypothetical protein
MRELLRGGSYRRKDECGTPSNKLESDWPLSLGCCPRVAGEFLGPMDLGQAIHTCPFHGSVFGWTVSWTDGRHSAIFSSCNRGGYIPRIRVGLHARDLRGRPRAQRTYCIVTWLANKVGGSAEMRAERSGYGRRMKQRHHFSLSSRAGKLRREHVIAPKK